MPSTLQEYSKEVSEELKNILTYWMQHTIDREKGGFYGRINHSNAVDLNAPKGSVLNSRILWAFSAAYNLTQNEEYLLPARRAYDYLLKHFIDKKYGGVYWTVDHEGWPLDTKKQIYALSFAIYGLSEFYQAGQDENAKEQAIAQYQAIIEHSYDAKHGGYTEAFTREWDEISDLRLSNKDANEKKSMNTNLHVLEAFTGLYRIWPDEGLKQRITDLINDFLDHIIDHKTHHLKLFFDDAWNSRSSIISYGHDIETAWLLLEAAEVIDDIELTAKVKAESIAMASAAEKGLDSDGGLWYEFDDHLVKEKHSWPQAEAMVGFFNAWQLTSEKKYFDHSIKSWEFVKQYMLDKHHGEWYWGVFDNHTPMLAEDKVGLWKCPYHNSRACIEIIKRINLL